MNTPETPEEFAAQLRSLVADQQQPRVAKPLGIGLVGAGNITAMHLRGCQWAGLEVVAITDANPERSAARAKEFGIPHVAASVDELLDIPEVGVVDVNFPGNARLGVVRTIANAGKPVLVQKPLADNYSIALAMVEVCERAGVALADLQNAIHEGRDPEVSGRANLPVLATIEGCYRSMDTRRTIDQADFLSSTPASATP